MCSSYSTLRVSCARLSSSRCLRFLVQGFLQFAQTELINRRSFIWVVVKIMVPFWVPIVIRHLIFRVPQQGTTISTATHLAVRKLCEAFRALHMAGAWVHMAH